MLQTKMSASAQYRGTIPPEHGSWRLGSLSVLNDSESGSDSVEMPRLIISPRQSRLRIFTFSELSNATKNFSSSLLVGEGGFGCVYRGYIKSLEDPSKKLEVAVKKLTHKGLQGYRGWLTEVNVLGVVEHPTLVKLIGYCSEDGERGIQRLLVYEYMPNKSIQEHLSAKSSITLSWSMRLRVALHAARGLTYLHEGTEFQIIFRDLKTSNILLDDHWNAKLSDFGLARQGPTEGLSHVSTAVAGTIGYVAPEYMQTGHLSSKSDVYSYGVILYELITGRRPIDRNRPKNEQSLLKWIKPYISNAKKFHVILDPRLEGDICLRSALKLASVANKCLVMQPKARPKISEVLEMVQRIMDNVEDGAQQTALRSFAAEEKQGGSRKKGLHLKDLFSWKRTT